ncbi:MULTISPECIES: hypothetical protein [unclassified Streptomyces]|uniref:hypothetical protein n=1 Tax=Streptomyces TaxID=1883 RepID=UPI0002E3753A|nr:MULTISPECIES: hypothetical protein [unclassified Streptomyces]MYR70400.1 hypothetical protein [Streptomyces sp. SID4939]MYS03093.1 hypothetical protein [Streptomyces sp. SID4940]MYT62362.1 hypothetical protein [Streptomyces sp. SID8357]MYT83842.1 hypothetical protein [Streptomyces sp. SID8360]MYU37003.1 hypothetical protein [Streptomyces sp. SID8358]
MKHSFVPLDESRGSALRVFFPPISRKELDATARRTAVVAAQRTSDPGRAAPAGPVAVGSAGER